MTLTREQIERSLKLRLEKVFVPDWEGEVTIRPLSAAERSHLIKAQLADDKEFIINTQVLIAAMSICDEAGNLLYDHTRQEDLAELGRQPARAFDVIVDAANKLNGFQATAVEEAKKNS